MNVLRSFRIWMLLIAVAAGLAGCGSDPTPALNVAYPLAPRPKPRNAALIAREVAGGKVSALLYPGRIRDHRLGPRLAALDPSRSVFEGTGIDPYRDFDRVFVTARTVRDEDGSVMVAEHALPQQRVRAALDVLVGRSQPAGQWLPHLGVPAARVVVRGRARVVAMAEPNVLVVVPDALASAVTRFVGTGGLPHPTGPDAVLATAFEPAHTARVRGVPKIPKTIRSIRAVVIPSADGGADVAIDGQSASSEQAVADAATLTRRVKKATSIDFIFKKVQVVKGIEFRAEHDRVKGERHLTAGEIEILLRMATKK